MANRRKTKNLGDSPGESMHDRVQQFLRRRPVEADVDTSDMDNEDQTVEFEETVDVVTRNLVRPNEDVAKDLFGTHRTGVAEGEAAANREVVQKPMTAKQRRAAERVSAPAVTAPVTINVLSMRETLDADLDALWSWVTQDEHRGAIFFGRPITSIRDMMASIDKMIDSGWSLLTVLFEDTPGALLVLEPASNGSLKVHLYLSHERRGNIGDIIAALQNEAKVKTPGQVYAVVTTHDEIARLYRPFGFETVYIMTWKTPELGS